MRLDKPVQNFIVSSFSKDVSENAHVSLVVRSLITWWQWFSSSRVQFMLADVISLSVAIPSSSLMGFGILSSHSVVDVAPRVKKVLLLHICMLAPLAIRSFRFFHLSSTLLLGSSLLECPRCEVRSQSEFVSSSKSAGLPDKTPSNKLCPSLTTSWSN